MTDATRELDAEVAKLMGWREIHKTDRDGYDRWFGIPPGTYEFDTLPSYSDRIEAAWPVAEQLGLAVIKVEGWWQAGKPSGIVVFRKPQAESANYVSDLHIDNLVLTHPAVALTAPLAICLAALATVST